MKSKLLLEYILTVFLFIQLTSCHDYSGREISSTSKDSTINRKEIHSRESEEPDSIDVNYYPSGVKYTEEYFYKNGDRRFVLYVESGEMKSETFYYLNQTVHYKKFNSSGDVIIERIDKGEDNILDTIYWESMMETK